LIWSGNAAINNYYSPYYDEEHEIGCSDSYEKMPFAGLAAAICQIYRRRSKLVEPELGLSMRI
jgi:hypothetical protein